MTHFLLTYDRQAQDSEITEFVDAMAAVRAFARRERELLGDDQFEVVLLSAKTLDEVRITHPNFFEHGHLLPSGMA